MRGELPVLTRCCFCFPLRYGLIVCGYVRLIVSTLFFMGASIIFYGLLGMTLYNSNVVFSIYTAILGFVLIMTLSDIALNIVFIVGGHRKNLKLLRTYYIYSFVLLILTTLSGIGSTLYTLFLYKIGEVDVSLHIWVILTEIASAFAQMLIQAYVILLVRSEIIKLRSTCQFRFVNNAAESECTMRCDDEIAGAEKGTGDMCERATYTPRDTCEFIGYVTRNDELH